MFEKDLVFSFQNKKNQIDIHDNPYVHVSLKYEIQKTWNQTFSIDIGLEECKETNHVTKRYGKDYVIHNYGRLYCINKRKFKPEFLLFGHIKESQTLNRIVFGIEYCN